jgi:hypothetical protein
MRRYFKNTIKQRRIMKAFTVCLVTKDEAGNAQLNEEFTGTAISEHLVPMPDQSSSTGVRFQSMIGVLWEDHRSPSPSYHSPDELHWISVPELEFEDDEDEEIEDDEPEYYVPQAQLAQE